MELARALASWVVCWHRGRWPLFGRTSGTSCSLSKNYHYRDRPIEFQPRIVASPDCMPKFWKRLRIVNSMIQWVRQSDRNTFADWFAVARQQLPLRLMVKRELYRLGGRRPTRDLDSIFCLPRSLVIVLQTLEDQLEAQWLVRWTDDLSPGVGNKPSPVLQKMLSRPRRPSVQTCHCQSRNKYFYQYFVIGSCKIPRSKMKLGSFIIAISRKLAN